MAASVSLLSYARERDTMLVFGFRLITALLDRVSVVHYRLGLAELRGGLLWAEPLPAH